MDIEQASLCRVSMFIASTKIQFLWVTARLLATRFRLIYPVDEFSIKGVKTWV